VIEIAPASSSAWVDAIGWMLLHSLWQGAAIAMALGLVLRLLRRAPAQARYLAACVAMAMIVSLPAASLRWPETSPSMGPDARAVAPAPTVETGPTFPRRDSASTTHPIAIRFGDRLRLIFPAVVGLWMTGAVVLSLRLLGGWVQVRRWVRRGTRPLTGPWIDRLDRIKECMGLRLAVILLESSRIEVPMVVGWIRPAILVPVAALSGLTAPEMEAILAHELAHIRRHDYLVNVLQCVVEALVFYHPTTWWISQVIRCEREHCCDDIAVAACRDRIAYARALASMGGLRAPAFSLSPAANGGVLLARVRRILKPQEESMNPISIPVRLAVILAVAPTWLLALGLGGHTTKADPGSVFPPLRFPAAFPLISTMSAGPDYKERNDPFPGRSFADIVKSAEEAPTCRFPGRAVGKDRNDPFPILIYTDIIMYIAEGPTDSSNQPRPEIDPVLTHVEFRGRKSIRQKELEDTTGLKVGSRADATHTRNALGQILRLYQDKGYDLAEFNLLEGGNPGETKVVIQIFEGPKVKIGSINFVGNEFASSGILRTHLATRKPIPGLLGKYHRDMLEDDKQKLVEFYQSHGFFEVKVTPVTRAGSDPGKIELKFVVHERMQYKVRDVIIEGNSKIKTAVLMDDLELHSGKPFLQAVRDADKARMLVKYSEIGCIDTQIVAEPSWTNEPGVIDLVYKIEEGEPYPLGELKIQGKLRTRDKVIRREAVRAELPPREVLDKNRIEIFRKRLAALGYFTNQPR
jgi:beta-lactamase regulating signal transducer with metallopeptidase domain